MKQKAMLVSSLGFMATALLSGLSVFYLLDHINPVRADAALARSGNQSTESQHKAVVSTPSWKPVDRPLTVKKPAQQSMHAEISNPSEPDRGEVVAVVAGHGSTRVSALTSSVEGPALKPADTVQTVAGLLEARFEAETYDPGWNDPLQEPLRRMFGETNLFAGSELVEANCQSTLCRVEFRHLEPGARDELMLTIVNDADYLPADLTDYFDYEIDATESGDGVPRTVVFVARPGHALRSPPMSQQIPQG